MTRVKLQVKLFKQSPNTWRRFEGDLHHPPVRRHVQQLAGQSATGAGPRLQRCLQIKFHFVQGAILQPLDGERDLEGLLVLLEILQGEKTTPYSGAKSQISSCNFRNRRLFQNWLIKLSYTDIFCAKEGKTPLSQMLAFYFNTFTFEEHCSHVEILFHRLFTKNWKLNKTSLPAHGERKGEEMPTSWDAVSSCEN